jgi:hypothetical protein
MWEESKKLVKITASDPQIWKSIICRYLLNVMLTLCNAVVNKHKQYTFHAGIAK